MHEGGNWIDLCYLPHSIIIRKIHILKIPSYPNCFNTYGYVHVTAGEDSFE